MHWPHVRPLLLLLCLPSCHTWQRRDVATLGPAPGPTVSGWHPVRLTRADGAAIVLNRAMIVGDSVIGEAGTQRRRTAVALGDVRRLEEQHVSRLRTALLVPAIALGALALVIAAAAVSAYS